MKSIDLFEAMGDLPEDILEIKKKRNYKKIAAVAAIFLVVVGIGAAGVNKIMFPKMIVGGGYETFAPVASFGLSPQQPVELLSENAVFTKADSPQDIYDGTIEYHVKLDEKTTFSIPYAFHGKGQYDNYFPPEILINGEKVTATKTAMPFVNVSRPMFDANKPDPPKFGQSVNIMPDYYNLDEQPENTYQLLYDMMGEKPSGITAETKFYVYDISGCETSNRGKNLENPSFTIEGSVKARCLVFSTEQCAIPSRSVEFTDESNTAGIEKCELYADSNSNFGRWVAILGDENTASVKINGEGLTPEVMTLENILSEKLNIASYDQQLYLNSIYYSFFYDSPSEIKIVVPNNASDNLSSDRTADLYQFEIDEPGECVISVQLKAVSAGSLSNYHMLQFIDSPASMWSKVGERKMQVMVDDQTYDLKIEKSMCNFIVGKNKNSIVSP